jgi:hypothetical protein
MVPLPLEMPSILTFRSLTQERRFDHHRVDRHETFFADPGLTLTIADGVLSPGEEITYLDAIYY